MSSRVHVGLCHVGRWSWLLPAQRRPGLAPVPAPRGAGQPRPHSSRTLFLGGAEPASWGVLRGCPAHGQGASPLLACTLSGSRPEGRPSCDGRGSCGLRSHEMGTRRGTQTGRGEQTRQTARGRVRERGHAGDTAQGHGTGGRHAHGHTGVPPAGRAGGGCTQTRALPLPFFFRTEACKQKGECESQAAHRPGPGCRAHRTRPDPTLRACGPDAGARASAAFRGPGHRGRPSDRSRW